jgi:hypothetical protein
MLNYVRSVPASPVLRDGEHAQNGIEAELSCGGSDAPR